MKTNELPALKLFVLLTGGSLLLSQFDFNSTFVIFTSLFSLLSGLFLLKNKLFTYSYFLWILASALIISQRFDLNSVEIPHKIIPSQNAVFSGEITNIVKTDKKYLRYFATGNLNCRDLPEIKNTGILLTVFSPKFALLPGDKFIADVVVNFPEGKTADNKFDSKTYLKSNELQWNATASGQNMFKTEGSSYFTGLSYQMRSAIKKRIFMLFDSVSAPVMTALITDDKSLIDPDIKKNFSLSGTSHILAVSGSHVALISFIIFTLFSFVSNRLIKSVLVIFFLFLFVFMTGFLPSALRSAIMITVYIISINYEQKINPLNSLSVAGIIMFIINPDVIYSISFQLSFLSVAGIIIFNERINNLFINFRNKSKFADFIISSISLTLAATLLISPLVAVYFKTFSIVSPLANIAVVPLMMLSLSFGICSLFASFNSVNIAGLYAVSSSFLINLCDKINGFAISSNFSYIEGSLSLWISVMISVFIIYIIFGKNLRNRIFRLSASTVCIFLVVLIIPKDKTSEIEIIPRQNLTALILNKKEFNYILLLDRIPSNKSKQDFELKNFILNSNEKLTVYYSGNSGISTIDAVKNKKIFGYYEISNFNQNKIIKLLNLKENPVKTINI